MSLAGHPLSPTSSLPPLRSLDTLSKSQIFSALGNLHELYCPISLSRAVKSQFENGKQHDNLPAQPVDSGYVSENEDEDEDESKCALDALRADASERNFAIRWLTTLIARADELQLGDEDDRERAVDKASAMLASFTKAADEDEEDDTGLTRDFSFKLRVAASDEQSPCEKDTIQVRLHDGPRTTTDHTDVGLQSWGAAIVFSDLVCASPSRFGLTRDILGTSSPRIIELGAGTGLVSLVLARALPRLGITDASLIATDYHPAVLTNLQSNIELAQSTKSVRACALDWSAPVLDLSPADVLVATDVIYAPEHATWLRDCAARLLAPQGVFWLLSTVRPSGRFAAVIDSVEAAFRQPSENLDGRRLTILDVETIGKRQGVGRGDESGYKLFRIGWA
ncbi:hypothetical protein AAE478_004141 [Parahypoxylon ruwenzoriense]